MADCEMCGKVNIQPIRIKVESTIMSVCKTCATYGKRLAAPKRNVSRSSSFSKKSSREKINPDENKRVIKNYGITIKEAREKMNLKQEDLAKKLNEKESLLHKVESGHLKPSFRLAKKLGLFLHIKLLEEIPQIDTDILIASKEGKEGLTMEELVLQAMKKAKK